MTAEIKEIDIGLGTKNNLLPTTQRGEIYGETLPQRILIIGPSGSGKTTLLHKHILGDNDEYLFLEYDDVTVYTENPEKCFEDQVDIEKSNINIAKILDEDRIKCNSHNIIAFDDVKIDKYESVINKLYRQSRKYKVSVITSLHSFDSITKDMRHNTLVFLIHRTMVKTIQTYNLINFIDKEQLKMLNIDNYTWIGFVKEENEPMIYLIR